MDDIENASLCANLPCVVPLVSKVAASQSCAASGALATASPSPRPSPVSPHRGQAAEGVLCGDAISCGDVELVQEQQATIERLEREGRELFAAYQKKAERLVRVSAAYSALQVRYQYRVHACLLCAHTYCSFL